MEISDDLRCLFSAALEERDGSYVLDVPKRELKSGAIQAQQTYRVAVLSGTPSVAQPVEENEADLSQEQDPPVTEGDRREVTIEDIGDQGDGIARVERGFVVIVPEAKQGERVTVEITKVRPNVAFGEVVAEIGH